MKEWKVKYSPKAYADLKGIYSFIIENYQSTKSAENVINKLRQSIKDLSFMADAYHHYQDEPYYSKGVRYYSEGKYCIFYEYDDETVTVLRIINGKRDLTTALAEC